ncbi:hypothetical protein DVH24_027423 [Malus domestica]|uniref:CCHC-type domain-containing protein n=1 Tax=Malus domestica TaxID=3750 RepID=A0A498HE20_MALDO|nr:hypothetical protein DVH24_027423 [Malus domestica]
MVMFKYCFCCGRLGHFNKYCEHEVPNVNKDYLYSIAMVGEQGTKLSRSGRLATYACARGCPNPRRGQQVFSHMAITKSATSVEDSNDIDTTSIDSATLKGVENPIILQGTGGWPNAATGD